MEMEILGWGSTLQILCLIISSLNIVNQSRTSYFNEELNLINRQLEREYKKIKDKEYLDNEDTMAIEEHKRMFQTKDKSVIKFKKK